MDDDTDLLARLRSGDEQAFIILVRRHHAAMLRLAATFVPSIAVAEEVVQDTWLGVLRGIGAFQGRSSVKTWLFRILVNRARTAGVRESRTVNPGRGTGRRPGTVRPRGPVGVAATALGRGRRRPDAGGQGGRPHPVAIEDLPPRQRQVVTLRDLEGLGSAEVCSILEISAANQRVLLHRGRSRPRQLIETEFGRIRGCA